MEGIPLENLPAPAPTVIEIDDSPLVEVPSSGAAKRAGFKVQCVHYLRVFIQFVFSYVGLTAILAGYLVFGAFVFQAIEAPVETRMRKEMRSDKKVFFEKMYDAVGVMRKENWTDKALRDLNILQKDFIHFYNYDVEIDGVNIQKWSFVGSMLFSLTVISTIGYGHIAPVTIPGQIFCILYALAGIPLMLLVLTNVGRVLANVARLLYVVYTSRLCQRVRMRCRQRRSRKKARNTARRRGMARKDSTRSTRSNRSRNNNKKSRGMKKTPSQATVRADTTEPYCESRPISTNMELIRSAVEPPMPPSYDESNEIEEKISDTRENAGMFSEKVDKPNMSEAPSPVRFAISPTDSLPDSAFPVLCAPPASGKPATGKAPTAGMEDLDFDDLSDLSEPEPEPIKCGTPPIAKAQSTVELQSDPEKVPLMIGEELVRSSERTRAHPTAKEGALSDDHAVEKKLGRTSSSITLGEHHEKRLPPRQFSCLELRKMDEQRSITFNMEGIAEEAEDSLPREDDLFLPKGSKSLDDLNAEVTGSASDLNKIKQKDRGGREKSKKKTKGKSKKDSELTTKTRRSKHRKNTEVRIVERRKETPKKRRTKRPVMSPPTLKSLHSKQLRILDSTTAVRLANYHKEFGSSRDDLTSLIPALKKEKVNIMCVYDRGIVRDRVHNPKSHRRRRTTDSGSTKSRARVDRRRRRKDRGSASTTPFGSDRTSVFDSDTESTDTDDPGADPLQQAEIPIGPVLAFFFSYITIGAIMFFFIQDNWNLFESFYFCFITLTTIGFGDYVPADKLYSLLACCVYTLVGMAVTSMCIALMMKKFVVTVKHIGRRVGIVGDED